MRLGVPMCCVSLSCCLLLPELIGRASLARENEAGGSWGQEVHILHVNIYRALFCFDRNNRTVPK